MRTVMAIVGDLMELLKVGFMTGSKYFPVEISAVYSYCHFPIDSPAAYSYSLSLPSLPKLHQIS